MALGAEVDADLKAAFQDLRELKVDVAYPFLLELYHDYAAGVLPRADLLAVVRLVESHVFRRAICAIPTNSMNKTFGTFTKALRKDRYLESIRAHLWARRRRSGRAGGKQRHERAPAHPEALLRASRPAPRRTMTLSCRIPILRPPREPGGYPGHALPRRLPSTARTLLEPPRPRVHG
jgi:hypothetical protein